MASCGEASVSEIGTSNSSSISSLSAEDTSHTSGDIEGSSQEIRDSNSHL